MKITKPNMVQAQINGPKPDQLICTVNMYDPKKWLGKRLKANLVRDASEIFHT